MKNRVLWWTVAAAVGLAVAGCGHDHNSGSSSIPSTPSTPTGNAAPTDFESFVQQQIQQQPGLGTAPAVTDSLTPNQGLGDANAFAGVAFPSGDALPAATYRGASACTSAGMAACSPGTSADLNSALN